MITKPTTLILGAGASVPYGFPTGAQLARRIIDTAKAGLSPHDSSDLLKEFDYDIIKQFVDAFGRSGKTSIDAFLEHRTEFIELGKYLIAYELIKCEQETNLFPGDKSWYEYLFGLLNTDFTSFGQNKLSILTFNYERSFEQYFLTVLQNSYGKSIPECAALLRTIPIIHLHGDLGALPILNVGRGRPYQNMLTDSALEIARSRIKIIHDDVNNDEGFVKAKEILAASQVICFLGFGFNVTSIRRLGFVDFGSYKNAFVTGSTMGLTMAERGQTVHDFKGTFRIPTQDRALDSDALNFLRHSGILHLH
jgi:hypothetical protein